MKQTSTLILPDDDGPTTVDPRRRRGSPETEATILVPGSDPSFPLGSPFEGSGNIRPASRTETRRRLGDTPGRQVARWTFVHWPLLLGGAALVAALSVAATVAYREHHASEVLRRAVEELIQAQERILSGEPPSSFLPPAHRPVSGDLPAAPMEPDGLERDTLELRGADLLIANDHLAALRHYRMLAAQFPKTAAFPDIVAVLQWKLRCDSREQKTAWGCP